MHVQLDPLLVAQHGLVTRRQAWEAGLSNRQIDHLVASGKLVIVHRGVFRDPAAPVTPDQRILAGVLAIGSGALASHRSAVGLWGAPNYQCLLSEVTARGKHAMPGIVTHRTQRIPEHTTLRGIPVTSVARTVIDVATVVSPPLLAKWLQPWLASKLLTLDDLETQLTRLRGHHGAPVVRALLDDRLLLVPGADSPPEADLGKLLLARGFPALSLHHVVTLPSGLVFELDWSYPELMIAFEVDGYGVHLRSLDAFENDRFRRNELEIEGWTVLNFTARQIRRQDTPVSQVRRALAARGVFV